MNPRNTMTRLTAPGKTFLVGEYLALLNGPSLILNTPPDFQLTVTSSAIDNAPCQHPFHPLSPAGKLAEQHAAELSGLQLKFLDPYKGLGGLGASSAEFTLLSKFLAPTLTVGERLKQYQDITVSSTAYRPSGADVAAQTLSTPVALINPQTNHYQGLNWSFPFSSEAPELSYCLIHTGKKLTTHQHLASLNSLDNHFINTLNTIAQEAIIAFQEKQVSVFCSAIQNYGDTLINAKLVTDNTRQLLKKCRQHPDVLASKGCGAMGADIILVLLNSDKRLKFKQWLTTQKLRCIASGAGC